MPPLNLSMSQAHRLAKTLDAIPELRDVSDKLERIVNPVPVVLPGQTSIEDHTRKLFLFDMDGTLIRSFLREKGARFESGVQEPADLYDHIELLPGRREVLDSLRAEGHETAIVTNQGGIAFGYQTLAQINTKLSAVCKALGLPTTNGRDYFSLCQSPTEAHGTSQVYVALHHPRAKDWKWLSHPLASWRKPGGGMIRKAMADYGIAPENTLYVGDMETDRQAAENAGVDYADVSEFFGPNTEFFGPPIHATMPDDVDRERLLDELEGVID